jgi:hypothetical protein
MQNLTPLGTSMHFKELDRQAAKELRALPNEGGSSFLPTARVRAILARLPRSVRANFLGRSLKHG